MNESGVKRFVHRRAGWTLVVALLSSASVWGQGVEGEFKGVKHSFLDPETGKRLMLLTSGSVTNISNEELLVRDGVKLQFFDDGGKTNLEVVTPFCRLNTRTKQVASDQPLQGTSPDGQFFLEGRGFAYGIASAGLVISNEVHAVIRRELLESAASPPSAPGPAPAPPAAAGAAGPESAVNIYSDRMSYQTNLSVFRDHVRVQDPQGKLTCGVLTVEFLKAAEGESKRRIDRILAEEDVRIDSAELHATGRQATYRQAAELVELTGDPTWRLRQYEGRGETLTVNRATREFHAARQVEMTLPPGSVGRSGFFLPESPGSTAGTPQAPPREAAAAGAATNSAAATAQPVRVFADDFLYRPEPANTNYNLALLKGGVRVNSGTGKLACEQMTIRSLATSNRTESVFAERGVVMEQGDRRVTGDEAVYTAAADTVEVTGTPAWRMGPRVGTAGLLVFDLTNGVYRARGGVRMQLPAGSLGRSGWLVSTNAPGPAGGGKEAGPSAAGRESGTIARSGGASTRPAAAAAKPVEISADEFEFHEAAPGGKTDTAIYRGAVRVQDADRMRLSCERLTARMAAGTNQVEGVIAEREVEIEVREPGAERRARGERAVYTADRAEVVMTGGDAVVIDFADPTLQGQARGARAVYAGGPDLLELTGDPQLTTPFGHVWGDALAVDRARTTLSATGRWKMTLNPDKWNAQAKAAAPGSAPARPGAGHRPEGTKRD